MADSVAHVPLRLFFASSNVLPGQPPTSYLSFSPRYLVVKVFVGILVLARSLVPCVYSLSANTCIMADYNYGGSEEENAELRKLETDLVCVASGAEVWCWIDYILTGIDR